MNLNTSTIIKLNFLLLGFGLTVYLIYILNTSGLSPRLTALFGLESTQTLSQKGSDRWNWCDTRVTSIILPNQFKISQEGQNWIRENGGTQIVDFLSVEKWFANFCTVLTQPVTPPEADDSLQVALIVKFVNGKVEALRRHPNGVFIWKGKSFKSPAFEAALSALEKLPKEPKN